MRKKEVKMEEEKDRGIGENEWEDGRGDDADDTMCR